MLNIMDGDYFVPRLAIECSLSPPSHPLPAPFSSPIVIARHDAGRVNSIEDIETGKWDEFI